MNVGELINILEQYEDHLPVQIRIPEREDDDGEGMVDGYDKNVYGVETTTLKDTVNHVVIY